MATVTVYSDLSRSFQQKCDIVLKTIDDYVDVYAAIKQAISSNTKLLVVVQNSYCLNYISEMARQYGDDHISIKAHSPRTILSGVLNTDIPDYITDDDIVQAKTILEADRLQRSVGMSFEDIILTNYFGMFFTSLRFPFNRLVTFLTSIDYDQQTSVFRNRVADKVYRKKLESWLELCNGEHETRIVEAFASNSTQLLRDISAYSIVRGYPRQIGEEILGQVYSALDKISVEFDPFIVAGIDTIQIQRNIKVYFNALPKHGLSRDQFESYLNNLSGLLIEEMDFVLACLDKHPDVIDEKLVEAITDKFSEFLSHEPQYRDRLVNLIEPPFPNKPNDGFSAQDWLRWANQEYLPYKFWLEANDSHNEILDGYASQYGDWVFQNYHQLLSGEMRILHRTLGRLHDGLSKDTLSLILMVDNFNFKYVPFIKDMFSCHGFSPTMEESLFSMLPTETSVSKAAFFSGEPYGAKKKVYEKWCNEWGKLINKVVRYLPDIGKLDEVRNQDADIYILNFMSVDKILHESQNKTALPIHSRIQDELRALVARVNSFARRIGKEYDITVYLTSDHGSTKISPEQVNLIEPKYYRQQATDAAHRFISVNDKQFKSYKDSLEQLCYALDKNEYGTEENYLIARKYYRFIKTDGTFYVHGGITPEENIIPLLRFEKLNAKLIEPSIKLIKDTFRYSVLSEIVLSVKNFNEFEMKNVRLAIIGPNVKWDQAFVVVGDISRESELVTTIPGVRIINTGVSSNQITVRLLFDFLGEHYKREVSFDIKMKSLQENKTDLDDLF